MYAKWGAWMRRGRCLMKCPRETWWRGRDGGRHAKVGMAGAAREVFDAMGERNVVSWTAMVAGTRNGWSTEAIGMYKKMRGTGGVGERLRRRGGSGGGERRRGRGSGVGRGRDAGGGAGNRRGWGWGWGRDAGNHGVH
ncbi:hypothetical protein Syun_030384 [Stephania yunnanensis]|uniref:Pentatricopeptide repeat protein n=1 Tax=Stephania yunnanensis TaxID=152371 RepID=A0AAP0HM88_9MAGN